MIQLLSEDTTRSNIKDLDFSNSHNINSNTNERNTFKTDRSLYAANKNNLEEIYTNILEQSINDDGNNSKTDVIKNSKIILVYGCKS